MKHGHGKFLHLCQATMLVSIGWYLLVPLPRHPEAPLSVWSSAGSYDTAKECQQAQDEFIDRAIKKHFKYRNATLKETQDAIMESQCVATDDPRLKDN
jgi:hypothetical protein